MTNNKEGRLEEQER